MYLIQLPNEQGKSQALALGRRDFSQDMLLFEPVLVVLPVAMDFHGGVQDILGRFAARSEFHQRRLAPDGLGHGRVAVHSAEIIE